jgi:myo-inositol-1(or 4)-monophosphatase
MNQTLLLTIQEAVINELLDHGKALRELFNNYQNISKKQFTGNFNNIEVKLEQELEIENKIRARIGKIYPEMGFVTEESALRETDREYVCNIDPLDGTKHFVNGIPLYAIGVSVSAKDGPILGAVYAPMLGSFYIGSEVTPTSLNGRIVKIGSKSQLENAYISVDLATRQNNWEKEKEWMHKKLIEFSEKSQRIRMMGLGALTLAWVASGNMDGYVSLWGHKEKPFDIEAGKALVKFAGGEIRNVKVPGIETPRLVAGNKLIVDQLERILLNH